jgi:hypothetical protein
MESGHVMKSEREGCSRALDETSLPLVLAQICEAGDRTVKLAEQDNSVPLAVMLNVTRCTPTLTRWLAGGDCRRAQLTSNTGRERTQLGMSTCVIDTPVQLAVERRCRMSGTPSLQSVSARR